MSPVAEGLTELVTELVVQGTRSVTGCRVVLGPARGITSMELSED